MANEYQWIDEYSTPKFAVRDILFHAKKARKGVLEKICIKEILFRKGVIIYRDTFNAIHNERDLITYEDALYVLSTI